MAEQACAQLHVDPAGGVAQQISAQGREGGFEQHRAGQADADHRQGGNALVHQHLVNHRLEKQGGDQGEQLQHQGCDQHLTQEAPVAHQGRDEPGEIEARQSVGQSCARGDEDGHPGAAHGHLR